MTDQPTGNLPPQDSPQQEGMLNQPLPNDLSKGWLPEDTRQRPSSPLPEPRLFRFQSLLPFKFNNALRHPGELPWLISAYVLTFLVYIGSFAFLVYSIASGALLYDTNENSFSFISQLVAIAVYLPLAIFIARAIMYAQLRITGVRITPTQFPEAYEMLVGAAHAAGMRRVPDAYVVLGNGQINAFASGHGHRRFIAIYSDLFEVGGAPRNPEALKFVIAHEVGHIAAGHVSYFRLIFTSFFRSVPVVGNIFSRTQEYTADNYGYRYCPQGAPSVAGLLSAGKYLLNEVNFDELANRAVYEKGPFTWLANLGMTHPPITWRAHALRDRNEPGRLIWRPKNNPPYPLSLAPAAEPAARWADPLQAADFMATYPEKPDNTHFGNVMTRKTTPARERDRTISDTLYSGWIPPHLRGPNPWGVPVGGWNQPGSGQDGAATDSHTGQEQAGAGEQESGGSQPGPHEPGQAEPGSARPEN